MKQENGMKVCRTTKVKSYKENPTPQQRRRWSCNSSSISRRREATAYRSQKHCVAPLSQNLRYLWSQKRYVNLVLKTKTCFQKSIFYLFDSEKFLQKAATPFGAIFVVLLGFFVSLSVPSWHIVGICLAVEKKFFTSQNLLVLVSYFSVLNEESRTKHYECTALTI